MQDSPSNTKNVIARKQTVSTHNSNLEVQLKTFANQFYYIKAEAATK